MDARDQRIMGPVQECRPYKRLTPTSAVWNLIEEIGGYWLLNLIDIAFGRVPGSEFMLVTVFARSDQTATVMIATDGTPDVFEHTMSWADLPVRSLIIHVRDGVVMLPEEDHR